MSRSTYAPKESYTGTGSLSAYTFDFKIEALTDLEIVEYDDSGVETQRVRGDDVTYLSSVEFDNVDGGGTVNLAANLPTNYTLLLLQANDEPTQSYEFRDKNGFNLKKFELALDLIAGAVQRLAYKGTQGLRINDLDDETAIDVQFPPGFASEADAYLKVNAAGDGLEYGLTLAELTEAILPSGTVTNHIKTWSGSAWVDALSGGAKVISNTQNITAGGEITVNAGHQQFLKIQGNGGPVTTSVSPFLAPPVNGAVITLMGKSASNIVHIPYSDTAGGCLLKGDAYLGLNDTLTLMYDASENRYFEISRNY